MPSTKPKLAQLETPMTSTFPSELSALSARSPLPGFADFIKQEDYIKTPITPPTAYTDFLKNMGSPAAGDKSSGRTTPTSAPSTGSSDHSDCSCSCESHKSPTSAAPNNVVFPTSAPSTGRLGRLRIPPSPAFSTAESPRSATSAVRSPFSARSARSPYDWDLRSKGRYFDVKSPKSTRSSVRQVREIVTRTVTYTPRMSPAPKGKRRKIE
ncbi:Uncharacterized protein BP5553_07725 [Venustampulla echinocandica]|uniref:Uncharacterized protein n=1 Tax=Venustampulla echinocandica TaxID=2656787 RepID=A0A370THC1_9HELO|nr:Uncharacterized protein BP5553_07725 [Venustampulla echinocandica]RDL34597.1 Uncharacterized protein BP5553_07725 [Venustampulla echinocandica]